jgi:two-component system phosphate regulon sensor histidine kinase PhoR
MFSSTRLNVIWAIFVPSLLLAVVLMLTLVVLATRIMHNDHRQRSRQSLETTAKLVRRLIASSEGQVSPDSLDVIFKELVKEVPHMRIAVLSEDGEVLADSERDPSENRNLGYRPEVADAVAGKEGFDERRSELNEDQVMYYALPALEASEKGWIIRTSMPTEFFEMRMQIFRDNISRVSLIALVVAGVLNYLVARSIAKPLDELKQCAIRFSENEFETKAPDSWIRELDELSLAMNKMAFRINENLESISHEKAEKEAILSSMADGVLAINAQERILYTNRSLEQMLGIFPRDSTNRLLQEVIRNVEIQKFFQNLIAQPDSSREKEVVYHSPKETHLQLRGAALRDFEGRRMGSLAVFHDVTRLKRLEQVRKDFVANVSHELRTPITAISGFAETLLEGSLDREEDVRDFLTIINNHITRITSIIDDLLILSRLDAGLLIERNRVPLREVIGAAVGVCKMLAEKKQVTLEIGCPAEMEVMANVPLLEQAIINLVSNAIQYSSAETTVQIVGLHEEEKEGVVIEVRDQGCGIAREHLRRIFERFYRVDKSRSRQEGGTGLGLSIVRHIAERHGGSVDVESQLGTGSVFRLHIPSMT